MRQYYFSFFPVDFVFHDVTPSRDSMLTRETPKQMQKCRQSSLSEKKREDTPALLNSVQGKSRLGKPDNENALEKKWEEEKTPPGSLAMVSNNPEQ